MRDGVLGYGYMMRRKDRMVRIDIFSGIKMRASEMTGAARAVMHSSRFGPCLQTDGKL